MTDDDTTDEDEVREVAKAAFAKGYELGKGLEELPPASRRVIDTQFERWWELNHKGDDGGDAAE